MHVGEAAVGHRARDQAEPNFATALVPSETACFASSPGRIRRTAVWMSLAPRVFLPLYLARRPASSTMRSNVSAISELATFMPDFEIPVLGCTCFRILWMYVLYVSVRLERALPTARGADEPRAVLGPDFRDFFAAFADAVFAMAGGAGKTKGAEGLGKEGARARPCALLFCSTATSSRVEGDRRKSGLAVDPPAPLT